MQGRKMPGIFQLCSENHKRSHPADGMAHTPASEQQRKKGNKYYNSEICNQSRQTGSGDAMVGHIIAKG